MITEKFKLPDGIEYEGKIHREVELRPQKVGDSINALEDERAQTNEAYLGLAVLARQIISLGSIPKDKITAELLMDLSEDDMVVINQGLARLRNRVKSFREKNKGSEEVGAGAPESGV
ncbi:hypothetical protein ASZ90_005605 [hydrocarbon metagenome]|uniref:Phage tail assembly protein n=1 Tax=hydrocarbon metagenome TaxID=938273 RepID=A0A0W8FUI1_9ZZZZ